VNPQKVVIQDLIWAVSSGDVGDLFDARGVFTLLPKVQLHVSALDNSHLQVVRESLESSYTRFNMGCVHIKSYITTF